LYAGWPQTNVKRAHGRKAKSVIESILLANKNERQKIAAIKIAQGESETGTSRVKVELPNRGHRRITRWIRSGNGSLAPFAAKNRAQTF
jgi:hypothetical protein